MLKRFLTHSMGYGFAEVGRQAIGLILLPVYARWLTPTDYGIVSVLSVMTTLLSGLLAWGMGSAVLRFLFIYKQPQEQRTFLTTMVVLLFGGGGLICAGLATFGGPGFSALFAQIPAHPFLPLVVWCAFLALAEVIPMTYLLARSRVRAYVGVSLGVVILRASCILLMVVGLRRGAVGKLEGELWGGLLMALGLSAWFWRYLGWRLSGRMVREVVAFGWPLIAHQGALWMLHASDRLILQRYVSLEQVATYSVGYTLAYTLTFVATAMWRAWSPHFYATAGTPSGSQDFARRLLVYTVLLGGVALSVASLAPELVHLLAGGAYAESARIIPWIVLGYLAFSMYWVGGQILHFARATVWLTGCSVISAVTNVLLNLWWIPRAGLWGAVAATDVAFVLLWVTTWILGLRRYPVPAAWRELMGWGSATVVGVMIAVWLGGLATWWSFVLRLGLIGLYGIAVLRRVWPRLRPMIRMPSRSQLWQFARP